MFAGFCNGELLRLIPYRISILVAGSITCCEQDHNWWKGVSPILALVGVLVMIF